MSLTNPRNLWLSEVISKSIYRVERIRVLPKHSAFTAATAVAEVRVGGSSQLPPTRQGGIVRLRDNMADYRSAYQLEGMIAELAGFDSAHILVTAIGEHGDFRAEFIGKVTAVTPSRARTDVDAACRQVKANFRLRL